MNKLSQCKNGDTDKVVVNGRCFNLADIYLDYTLNNHDNFQLTNTKTNNNSNKNNILLDKLCKNFYTNEKFSMLNLNKNEQFLHDTYLDNLNLKQEQQKKNVKNDEQTELIEINEAYDDYENSDVISLNVDFSNDDHSENESKAKQQKSSSEINLSKLIGKQNHSREMDSGCDTFKFELNPQKYTLELSTLSSSISTSLSTLSSGVSSPGFSSNSLLSFSGESLFRNKTESSLTKSSPNLQSLNKSNLQQKQRETHILKSDLNLNKKNFVQSSSSKPSNVKTSNEVKRRKPLPNYENLSFSYVNSSRAPNRSSLNLDSKNLNFSLNEAKCQKSTNRFDDLKIKFYTVNNLNRLINDEELEKKFKPDLKASKKPINKIKIDNVNNLDDFLLVKILSNLSTLEKLRAQFVCKRWHSLIWSNQNRYKLFNRLEFSEQDLILNKVEKNAISSSIRINKNLSFKNFFFLKRKKSNIEKRENEKIVDLDLVFKFLLNKFLNRALNYAKCNCVETIWVKNCPSVSDRSLELIAERCPELKYLTLNNCVNVKTMSVLKVVKMCPNLKLLDLTGCFNVNNILLVDLKKNEPRFMPVSHLQCVDLSYCLNVTDLSVENICKNCALLSNLYLRKCKQLSDLSLLFIAKYCANLRELSLSQCSKIGDVGVRYLGKETNYNNKITPGLIKYKIKYLSLGKCVQVSDQSLIYLSKLGFFENIKYLNLRGCSLVSDKFLKYFTGSYSVVRKDEMLRWRFSPGQLRSLDLSGCAVSDKGVGYLCRVIVRQAGNVLHRLSLRGCDRLTDYGVKLLALNCKHLQHLNVTNCTQLTAESLRLVKINCKSCIIQHTNFSFC